ncbi:MAG TPA: molybdenum cofactor guanylyltransferase [Desulfomonilia bacterium]
MIEQGILPDITAAVLIGGKSRRFGRDKVIEPLDGVMLVEKVVSVLNPLFSEIILVGHFRQEIAGYKTVSDIIPGCGPLGGIYTALVSSANPYCFIFAADMPNLNMKLISYMAGLKEKADIIIPRLSKGIEPLHAIYSKAAIPVIKTLLEKNRFKILNLIEQMNTEYIGNLSINKFGDPLRIFSNINTTSDIEILL